MTTPPCLHLDAPDSQHTDAGFEQQPPPPGSHTGLHVRSPCLGWKAPKGGQVSDDPWRLETHKFQNKNRDRVPWGSGTGESRPSKTEIPVLSVSPAAVSTQNI